MKFKETKKFNDKKITIRLFSRKDLKHPEKFQDFVNSLVEEGAQIGNKEKIPLNEEIKWLKEQFEKTKKHQQIRVIAEHNDIIVGNTRISLREGRENHVGKMSISVRKGYRDRGLGGYLLEKVIKMAKRKLKPIPKIIRTSALSTNEPAISFYRDHGFKEVARIPDQLMFQGKLVDEVIMLLYL